MKDYAHNYRQWISKKINSLEAKELRYQTKTYHEMRKDTKVAQNRLIRAQHELTICSAQEKLQAGLLREI